MFLDAIQLNAIQGKTLQPNDIERVIEVSKDLKIRPAFLAGALSMTATRIKGFEPTRIDAAISVQSPWIQRARSVVAELVKVPEPVRTHNNSGELYFIRYVIRFLSNTEIDVDNERLMDKLAELYRLLGEIF